MTSWSPSTAMEMVFAAFLALLLIYLLYLCWLDNLPSYDKPYYGLLPLTDWDRENFGPRPVVTDRAEVAAYGLARRHPRDPLSLTELSHFACLANDLLTTEEDYNASIPRDQLVNSSNFARWEPGAKSTFRYLMIHSMKGPGLFGRRKDLTVRTVTTLDAWAIGAGFNDVVKVRSKLLLRVKRRVASLVVDTPVPALDIVTMERLYNGVVTRKDTKGLSGMEPERYEIFPIRIIGSYMFGHGLCADSLYKVPLIDVKLEARYDGGIILQKDVLEEEFAKYRRKVDRVIDEITLTN